MMKIARDCIIRYIATHFLVVEQLVEVRNALNGHADG